MHVGVIRIILLHVQRLVVGQARVLGVRAVEERDGDGRVAHGGGGQRGLHLVEDEVLRVLRDIRDGRQVGDVVLERDQAGRLEHAQRARLVDDVVHDRDAVAVLDLIERGVLLGVDAQRRDQRVADGDQLDAMLLAPVVHEVVVLEGVEVDVAVGQRLVGDDVVGELDQLDVDALLREGRDDDLLPLLVVLADDADLHGLGQRQRAGKAQHGGQRQGKKLLHIRFPPFVRGDCPFRNAHRRDTLQEMLCHYGSLRVSRLPTDWMIVTRISRMMTVTIVTSVWKRWKP